MKNFGYYGHSNCAYRSPDSLVDIVANNFSAEIINIGVRQGSEERILYELKKTKNLDLAIIFHCPPSFLFLPNSDRDIGIISTSQSKAEYMFNKWNQFAKLHHKKFIEKFGSADEFWAAVQTYKNYFYDPDLQLNRYYGALIQIDSYLTARQIPCIHIVDTVPNWFKFTSGIVDYSINDIIKQNQVRHGDFFVNCVTKEGNRLIANKLIELVNKLNSNTDCGGVIPQSWLL